jgi:hypothetical protein
MKNLPDNELFDEIGNRLRNYTEQPDEDVWNKIAVAIQTTHEPKWIFKTLYASTAASIVAFLLLVYMGESVSERRVQTRSTAQQKSTLKKSETEKSLKNGNRPGEVITEKNIRDFKVRRFSAQSSGDKNQNSIVSNDVTEDKTEASAQYLSKDGKEVNREYKSEAFRGEQPSNEIEISSDSTIEIGDQLDSVKVQNKKALDAEKKKRRKGILFYATITPSLSYQKVTPLQNDQITVDRFESGSVLSGDRFGVSIEVGVQGKISKRFEYYGGLSYYQQNQTLNYRYQSSEGTTLEKGGDALQYTLHPGEHNNQVAYHMKNLGAQAGVLYYLKGERLTHKVGAGLSFQQGLQKAATHTTYDNSKSSYLFYQLFYRTEFTVNKSMRVFFQPNFNQAILSNEKLSEPFKLKPYRAGLSFGILYHF